MFIKRFIKRLANNKLLNTSLKNSIQVVVKFIVGILNIKIVALIIEPTGMALVSQFQNFLLLGSNLTSIGLNNGIVKYISQYQYSVNRKQIIFSTSLVATIVSSFIFGLCAIIFATNICEFLFDSKLYKSIIQSSGLYFLFTSLVNLYLSFLNGSQNLRSFIKYNILTSISSFITGVVSVYFWGLIGLLWGQILLSVVPMILIIRHISKVSMFEGSPFSFYILRRLANYSLMAIVSGTLSPMAQSVIRKIIAEEQSWHVAGLWDGINKVSNNYISLVTLSFTYYFLPSFSQLTTVPQVRKEVYKSVITLVPILLIGAGSIFLFRNTIISFLFSNEFKEMNSLFMCQTVGDFFKVLSWVIGFLFIARENTKLFVFTEIASLLLMIIIAKLLIPYHNLPVNMYYLIDNIIYFTIMIVSFNIVYRN
ncbi:O-antigen translocase [Saccharicrinis aurantiacus]|uniref:O-antigen translocase n=1 Tax=Saccharicrinis aurantiacus TaxID=1849719 RepID=UPI002490E607|nr:O-antigen translocase [Saccharicrinis aurantiacus]